YCSRVLFLLFSLLFGLPPLSTLFPYTTLFRSDCNYIYYRLFIWNANAFFVDMLFFIGFSLLFFSKKGEETISYLYYGRIPSINLDRKSTRLNSSHVKISYAVFCLKKKLLHHQC